MPRTTTRTRALDGSIVIVHTLEDDTLTVRLPGGIQVMVPTLGRDALAARVSRHKAFMGHALEPGPAHRLARALRRASSVEVRPHPGEGFPMVELRRYGRVVTVPWVAQASMRALTRRHARPEVSMLDSIHTRVNMKPANRRIDAQFMREAGRTFRMGEILTHQHLPF